MASMGVLPHLLHLLRFTPRAVAYNSVQLEEMHKIVPLVRTYLNFFALSSMRDTTASELGDVRRSLLQGAGLARQGQYPLRSSGHTESLFPKYVVMRASYTT